MGQDMAAYLGGYSAFYGRVKPAHNPVPMFWNTVSGMNIGFCSFVYTALPS